MRLWKIEVATLCMFGSEGTTLEPFFLGDLFTLACGLGAAE
jgi:hypothetical protein